MRNYVALSLEIHLFFCRIMKEHSLFLLAGFPAGEKKCREQAEYFLKGFEDGLRTTVQLANGIIGNEVLDSGEIVTEFTCKAEQQTEKLTGIAIDSEITLAEQELGAGCQIVLNREKLQQVRMLNRRMLQLVNELIEFKEQILKDVTDCRLYTSNYPLLIEHILREARLYCEMITELERRGWIAPKDQKTMELFWNRIMMEHAQFIRGLLDPSECELMKTACGFADDYCRLLEEAREQDQRATNDLTQRTIQTTKDYRNFKTAGTQGITECRVRSVILPLLADHVLREANHYLRLLETPKKGRY